MPPGWFRPGKVLVDERDLWPQEVSRSPLLAVCTDFLKAHPDTVRALISGDLDATDFIAKNPAKAQLDVADVIAAISGKPLKAAVIAAAWKQSEFTVDPVSSSLLSGSPTCLRGRGAHYEPQCWTSLFADLSLPNQLLRQRGKAQVAQ